MRRVLLWTRTVFIAFHALGMISLVAEASPDEPIRRKRCHRRVECPYSEAATQGVDDGLAYHWSFDNEDALDSVREVNGQIIGDVLFADGVLGKAAVIRDDSTRIDIQSPSLNLDGWEQVTVSMWCKMTGYSTYGRVLSRAEGNEGCGVALHVGGRLGSWVAGGFWVFMEDGSYLLVRPETFRKNVKPHPKAGVWYHLVGTYDGKRIRFYVNGQLDGQQSTKIPNLRIRDLPEARLVIGRAAQSPKYDGWHDTYFPGFVDELTIWKRALSPREVKTLYEKIKEARTAVGQTIGDIRTPQRETPVGDE